MNDSNLKIIDKSLSSENSKPTADTALTYNSRLKKRKMIVLGKFGVGRIISSIFILYLFNHFF